MNSPPLIIVGMHRSGTSILARLLSQLGVWLGADCHPRRMESLFFRHTNDALLSLAQSSWYRPQGFLKSLVDPGKRVLYRKEALEAWESRRTVRYFGLDPWARNGSLIHEQRPWGWKDPRNSLALKVWLEIFPHAKVLHVVRNGIDAADSLLVRDGCPPEELHPTVEELVDAAQVAYFE